MSRDIEEIDTFDDLTWWVKTQLPQELERIEYSPDDGETREEDTDIDP